MQQQKATVPEGKYVGFFAVAVGKERNDSYICFYFSLYMSYILSIVHEVSNSYILIFILCTNHPYIYIHIYNITQNPGYKPWAYNISKALFGGLINGEAYNREKE